MLLPRLSQVYMHVDKTRGHDQPTGVKDLCVVGGRFVWRQNGGHPPILDQDIPPRIFICGGIY
jgi:hypothetical protein